MQVASSPSRTLESTGEDRIIDLSDRLSEDFGAKLKVDLVEGDEEREIMDEFEYFETREEEMEEEERDGDDDDGGEEDFSFNCVNPDGSPITADEAFQDGQIRPVIPVFNRDLLFSEDGKNGVVYGSDDAIQRLRPPLKKLFVENREESSDPQGPFCSWTGKTVRDASPETCKKSNSTGFGKLRRFRDLVLRSNSDGKDAFVFLHCNNNNGNGVKNNEATAKQSLEKKKSRNGVVSRGHNGNSVKSEGGEGKRPETASSAHERLYVRNRATREGEKHRSYLPYKQVGFFTDVNGLSRNIHPF